MPSAKIFVVLVGILLAIMAVFNTATPVVKENWNWGAMTYTAVPGAKLPNGKTVALGGNYLPPNLGSGKFVSTPSFQAILSPRFSNVQYGANIRYNMPDVENQAVPCEPLTFGSMAKENYVPSPPPSSARQEYPSIEGYCANGGSGQCGGDNVPSCGKGGYGLGHKVAGGYELPSNYSNGNWQQVYDSLPGPVVSRPCEGESHAGDMPIGTMATMDPNGDVSQVVAFNRLMTTNMKSHKRALGDPIRGDLAVVPCQSGWFSVYPTINVDLNPGAMNVLNGMGSGESYNQLMNLLVSASGGVGTAYGGIDMAEALSRQNVNMAGDQLMSLASGMSDVNVTAFP